jgi:hypothetical protein
MTDRDISESDLASFSLCRLPTQACQGCNEFFPDADLDELEEGSVLLYCADCIFDAQKRSDQTRDESFYG